MSESRFDRITIDPEIMGGKPTIRDTRVTIGTILHLLSAGYAETTILDNYPYLDSQDIQQALEFAARRINE